MEKKNHFSATVVKKMRFRDDLHDTADHEFFREGHHEDEIPRRPP
jgi:hypothetical protein